MKTAKSTSSDPMRKTLLQQQAEVKVRDPGAFANHQVSELDKNVHNTLERVHQITTETEKFRKDLHHTEDQISRLMFRYEPLCAELNEKEERRKALQQALERLSGDEKQIKANAKEFVFSSRIGDAKMLRHTASMELQAARGYDLSLNSTFRQTKKPGSTGDLNKSGTLSRTGMTLLAR